MPPLRDAGEGSDDVLDNHWSERLGARGREGLSKRWRHLAYYTLRYEVPLFFLVALNSTSRLSASYKTGLSLWLAAALGGFVCLF